jgi:hypothetical protein
MSICTFSVKGIKIVEAGIKLRNFECTALSQLFSEDLRLKYKASSANWFGYWWTILG